MCYFNGHIRPLGSIEPESFERLKIAITDISDSVWDVETDGRPNNFSVFESTQHIIFQFPSDPINSHLQSEFTPLWPDYEDIITPIIHEATKPYQYSNGKTGRIMLARLLPQGVIKPHIDSRKSADVPHKIHVPIITNPKVKFFEQGKPYFLKAGEAYEVNNKIPHGVANHSELARVHLIFDYYDAR